MSTIWTDQFLDEQRQIGDPAADAALDAIVAERGEAEARRLFDLLIRNIDLPLDIFPDSIGTYLSRSSRLPDWTDWNKVALAQALFLDHGPKMLMFLYFKSLPLLYSCARGAEVLVRTSRLTHDGEDMRMFARRIAETGQFLLDVMTHGALHPGGRGIRAIQKVRLIHASIRRFMTASNWDRATLGVPVNQEDMALTLMTFSVALIDSLAQFSIEEQEERLDAFIHTWTAIGHNLGVQPTLLPSGLAEARGLMDVILSRQSVASEAGQLLTSALIAFSRENLPVEVEQTPELLITHLLGRERAAALGVRPKVGCLGSLLPAFLKTYFRLGERLEDRFSEPLDLLIEHLARRMTQAMVNYFDQYKGRHFSIPERLRQAWWAGRE